jgi:hypothetical protein
MERDKDIKTIYFGHSRFFDYEKEWYEPARSLSLDNDIKTIFPHDAFGEGIDTRELFEKGHVLFVAEVSFPSTGLGIELGYARILRVPIVCFYRTGSAVSGSIRGVTDQCIEYSDTADLQKKLGEYIEHLVGE